MYLCIHVAIVFLQFWELLYPRILYYTEDVFEGLALRNNSVIRWPELTQASELLEGKYACSVTQLCLTLCDPPGSSVHGIFQAKILEQKIALSFSRGFSWPRDWTCVSCVSWIGRWILYHWATRYMCVCVCVCVLVTQSCPTLCDPVDCSPSGASVHGILQAVILEWVAIPFSRGSSQPRDMTPVSYITGRFFIIWATREAHLHI